MLILTVPSSVLLPGFCALLAVPELPDSRAPPGFEPDPAAIAATTRPDIRDLPPVARMRCPPFAVAAKTRICGLSRLS